MYYKLYGYILNSNIELPLLQVSSFSKEDKVIVISYKGNRTFESRGEPYITEKESIFYFEANAAYYCIDTNKNEIVVYSESIEGVHSTIFNIPFALFLLSDDGLLLHSSSVMMNGNVYGFVGEKGKGKSTLVAMLIKLGEKVVYFSDDTLPINNKLECCNGYRYFKLLEDSYECLEFDKYNDLEKNIQGKAYVVIDSNSTQYTKRPTLKSIFIIKRTKDVSQFAMKEITGDFVKDITLISNLIGIDYLPKKSIDKIKQSEVYVELKRTCKLYYLELPDNLEYLKQNSFKKCFN